MEKEPFMQEHDLKQQTLQLLEDRLVVYTYPGYPMQKDRLVLSWLDQQTDQNGRLVLPDGPWHIPEKIGTQLPTAQEQTAFLAQGLQLDSMGRPLHPWHKDMLQNPRLGAVTGKGFYYNWGPNKTADVLVHNAKDNTVLLIVRNDSGQLAMPGGFVDPQEEIEAAARRELTEETTIKLPKSALLQQTYKGPVGDPRSTIHAWAETTCYLTTVDSNIPCQGQDDAQTALWLFVDQIEHVNIFASHKVLIKNALGLR